jgi:signal transduction histidine kinase
MELLSAFAAQAALAIENARNLRDLAEANRTLRETQAQLVQSAKMSAIGQLAAGISHEVRNPLHVIGGSIYYLRELLRGTQNPKVEECLSHIEGEVGRAVGLIDNLLALARPQDAPFEELSLNDVVARSLGLVRAMAEKRGVAIEVDLADRLPPVLGNAGQLQQVALNVLLNGIQALEGRGGKIRVRTTAEEAVVRAEFEDDGPGIAPEVMEKIFEPFFSGREGGTGLGLYVCYGIARRHGGRIECRSEPGRGATFTVTLPAIKEAERSAVAPARA